MLKYLGMLSCILIVIGCSSTTADKNAKKEYTAEELKTRWEMEGRGPEWKVSMNSERFHGSFPGRYEGHVMRWDAVEKDNVTTLTAKGNKYTKIVLIQEPCTVAEMEFTHTATININKDQFTGCAKRRP